MIRLRIASCLVRERVDTSIYEIAIANVTCQNVEIVANLKVIGGRTSVFRDFILCVTSSTRGSFVSSTGYVDPFTGRPNIPWKRNGYFLFVLGC